MVFMSWPPFISSSFLPLSNFPPHCWRRRGAGTKTLTRVFTIRAPKKHKSVFIVLNLNFKHALLLHSPACWQKSNIMNNTLDDDIFYYYLRVLKMCQHSKKLTLLRFMPLVYKSHQVKGQSYSEHFIFKYSFNLREKC